MNKHLFDQFKVPYTKIVALFLVMGIMSLTIVNIRA